MFGAENGPAKTDGLSRDLKKKLPVEAGKLAGSFEHTPIYYQLSLWSLFRPLCNPCI
jgi:hypothetical protein